MSFFFLGKSQELKKCISNLDCQFFTLWKKKKEKKKKRIVRNDGWRENGGKTAFERWSECSIKRSSTEDKKVKEGWKGRGYRDRREGHDKERKAREKARSRRYSSWTRDTSLYPHSATSWLKQLLLQLSLANPAFRAVSRTPLGDFGDEPSNHVFRSRFWMDLFLLHLPRRIHAY